MAACCGAVSYSPIELAAMIARLWHHPVSDFTVHEFIWFNLRLPRLLLAVLVGASLAAGGAVMQSLFRNPLADPMLIGISAGGAMAAVVVIVVAAAVAQVHTAMLPVAAFAGCLAVSLMIYQIAKVRGQADIHVMLLAGIAFNALATAVIGGFVLLADAEQLRSFMFWMLGSLSGINWTQLGIVSVFILPAMVLIISSARVLDVMTLGERNAAYLGIRVNRWKFILIVAVALCVGASVSVSGLIAFVGLIAPHLARAVCGAGHRALLPVAILLGGLLTLLADLLARLVILPLELPIGIVTALLGIPLFLSLALKRRSVIA